MPSKEKVAGIVWAECHGIRASSTVVTSHDTYLHRLAIALCVVNRGRQNLHWGEGRQTCVPSRGPSASDLMDAAVAAAWSETQRAANAALRTASLPLDSSETLSGAQLYCHTWTAPIRGMRLGGNFVAAYRAWDPRDTIRVRTREGIVEYDGPCWLWLSVHVICNMRDNAMAREAAGRSPASAR